MLINEKSLLLSSSHVRVSMFIENSTQKQFDEEFASALDTVKKRYQELIDTNAPLSTLVEFLKRYEFWHEVVIFTAQQHGKLPKDYKMKSVIS